MKENLLIKIFYKSMTYLFINTYFTFCTKVDLMP